MQKKTADHPTDPEISITGFEWEVVNNVPQPKFISEPRAPPELMNVISCQCKATGEACSQRQCNCSTFGLPCTVYCLCEASSCVCHNTFTKINNDEEDGTDEGGTGDETTLGVDASQSSFLGPLDY